MKPVANSYSVNLALNTYSPAIGERIAAFVPTIPNSVWLAMLLLATSLLAFSTLVRARGQVATVKTKHAVTQNRLVETQNTNAELKAQTQQLRTNVRAAAQAAQTQLHLVKPNEIVIATR